jgi:hypothetical protein
MTINPLKKKVERELEVKEWFEYKGKIFFISITGKLIYLPKNYYFARKEELRKYFSSRQDLNESQRAKRILENLSIFGKELPDDPDPRYKKTITLAYQSNAVSAWIIKNYPPSEDWMPHREDRLSDLRESDINPWDTASKRNSKYWVFARKIRDKLRKELYGSD